MSWNSTKLNEGETMAQFKRRMRFQQDVNAVHTAIRQNPGIGSKWEIASVTGLDVERVRQMIRAINHDDLGLMRVDYGNVRVEGENIRGWYSMDRARHHQVLDQADDHSARVEHGVHRSRVIRVLATHNEMSSAAAAAAVDSILTRLGLDPAMMTNSDWDALEALALDGSV